MSERKVVNKWIDPEFDLSKIDTTNTREEKTIFSIRMMLPMTVKCLTCDNYMNIGTKFNMRTEILKNEDYLGIAKYRFYFKCTKCYTEVTFKTDPKNFDYVCEWGIRRKHEEWKDMKLAEEEYKSKKEKEIKEDVMKSLEYKKYDAQLEQSVMDAIENIKSINKRLNILNVEDSILLLMKKEKEEIKNNNAQLNDKKEENKEFNSEEENEIKRLYQTKRIIKEDNKLKNINRNLVFEKYYNDSKYIKNRSRSISNCSDKSKKSKNSNASNTSNTSNNSNKNSNLKINTNANFNNSSFRDSIVKLQKIQKEEDRVQSNKVKYYSKLLS